jgi:SLT domain-containing protein
VFASPSAAQAPKLELHQLPPKLMAAAMVKKDYIDHKKQFACLDQLLTKESGWRVNALNRSSGAFGLFQFMPSTWGNYKFPYKPKDAYTQMRAGLRYVHKRYGSPCAAWNFWKKQAGEDLKGGWY